MNPSKDMGYYRLHAWALQSISNIICSLELGGLSISYSEMHGEAAPKVKAFFDIPFF